MADTILESLGISQEEFDTFKEWVESNYPFYQRPITERGWLANFRKREWQDIYQFWNQNIAPSDPNMYVVRLAASLKESISAGKLGWKEAYDFLNKTISESDKGAPVEVLYDMFTQQNEVWGQRAIKPEVEAQIQATKEKARAGGILAQVRTGQEEEQFERRQKELKEASREKRAEADRRLGRPSEVSRSFGEPELVERLAGMIGQAQALGIKTGGYEQFLQKYAAGTLGGEVNTEEAMGNEIRALQAQTHTRRAIEQKRESALMASEYPAWFRRFQQALGQGAARFDLSGPGIPVRDITREEDIFSMWEDPAFKEARLQRETGLLEQFPTLYSAFRSQPVGEREKGFQPWVQSMPETRAFYQTRMAELTRPQRKPTPRWLPARDI